MRDYEVGYRKPPVHSRFKKGVCPNPKGRGGKTKVKAAEIVRRVLNEPVAIQERGRSRKIPRWQATVRRLFSRALRGDPRAASDLLKLRNSPELHSNDIIIRFTGGLPEDRQELYDANALRKLIED